MGKPDNFAAQLEEILRKETGILQDLHACQKRMYDGVLARDWIKLQKETELSESITNSFLELEGTRTALVRTIMDGAEGSQDFYQVTGLLAEPERSRVNALFREVKRLLLLSKSENDVFNAYIVNAKTVVSGLIETALPARRNRIYTRRGSLASANVESVVLNRSF